MKSTLQKAKVSFEFREMDASGLATFADGTVAGLTGNAFISAVPVALATISAQTTALRATLQQIAAGDKSPALTAQEAQQANALMLSLASNGHSVEDQANILAAGDLKKAQQIILSTGYKLKKRGTPHPRDFEVVETGPGFVHLRVKKAKKGVEAHLWRYGITTAKGTPPPTVKLIVSVEVDIIIHDLASNIIIGVQHASVLPAAHTKKTNPASTQTSKSATLVPLSKTRHPMFSAAADELYQWTDFIYAVIP